jgi:hypothetical protein
MLLGAVVAIFSFGQTNSRNLQTPPAAPSAYGTWKMNPALSKREGKGQWARSYTFRYEPHPAGERVTISRVTWDGRHETEMYLLGFDGKDYPFVQSSRFDTSSARKLPDGGVEELVKKDGKVVLRGVRRFSSDGRRLIQEYHWMPPQERTAILVLERENEARE